MAVALGVGAVEAALERPGVGGRRADTLGSGPVARADVNPGHLLRVFLELWLANLHGINFLSCGGKYNTHNPYCYALACVCVYEIDGLWFRTR